MNLQDVFLVSVFIFHCNCANILGIIPTPSYSHQRAYINLWKALSLKGHHVTVLTTDPIRDPALTNLTEIDISIGYEVLKKNGWYTRNSKQNPISFLYLFFEMATQTTEEILNLPDVQELIHDTNVQFDVVFVESVYPDFLVFGEVFKAPTIVVTSFDASAGLHKSFLNPTHPIIYPETYVPTGGELTFPQRVISVTLNWIFNIIRYRFLVIRQEVLKRHFGDLALDIDELVKKSSMLFISVSPALVPPRALSPRTINIGGESTITEPKSLPDDLKTFLDVAKQGAILFSLGTNVQSEHLGDASVRAILAVFKELPYQVLWKFVNKDGYDIPPNVKIVDWIPQQDILRHPNVKLFITQGGLQSLEEAINFQVPIVGVPLFSDQINIILRLESKGVTIRVPSKPSISATVLKSAILEVLTNASYARNLKVLKDTTMDRPMSGTESAIWWTEFVIRHKGNLDFMIHYPERNIPLYQYFLLDVCGFLLVILVILIGIIYGFCRLLKCLFYKVFRFHSSNVLLSKKKLY